MIQLSVIHPDHNLTLEGVLLFESRVIDLQSAAFVSRGCYDIIVKSLIRNAPDDPNDSDLDGVNIWIQRSGEPGLSCSVQVYATNAIDDDTVLCYLP